MAPSISSLHLREAAAGIAVESQRMGLPTAAHGGACCSKSDPRLAQRGEGEPGQPLHGLKLIYLDLSLV